MYHPSLLHIVCSFSVNLIVQHSHHRRNCTLIIFEVSTFVFFELLFESCGGLAKVQWKQVCVLGISLGFDGPFEAGLSPECVQPWKGGQGECMAVASEVQSQYTG